MKHLVAIVIALFAFVCAEAQTIALGERTPRLKKVKWLNAGIPDKYDFTYIEFIHSASLPCKASVERLLKMLETKSNVGVVLITHESASEIGDWVVRYVSPRVGVVVDDESVRRAFGVNYAPFAVIVDSKRRALWFGNPNKLEQQYLEDVIH